MWPRGPLMFLLQWGSMWPQSTSFIVTKGNTGAFIIPPASPFPLPIQNSWHNPSVKGRAAWIYVVSPGTRGTSLGIAHTRTSLIKNVEIPGVFKVSVEPGDLFFSYHSVFSTSKAFIRVTISVKAVPTHCLFQSKSLSHLFTHISLNFVI